MTNDLNVLGLETSCDDTCISIFNNKDGIISEYIFTQKIHFIYGGTVPELASRDHLNKIFNIILFVLKKKSIKINNLKGIAYTKGPGLKGPLLIGAGVAKSLSIFLNIPSVGVNHLEAHFIISFIFNLKLKIPSLVLLISGAHTLLLKMNAYNKFVFIGDSLDDGVGETFDKVARLLNLSPANGISIEKNIKYKIKYNNLKLGLTLKKSHSYNFSFSGLKSEILRFKNKTINIDKENLIYNFQNVIINILLSKCRSYLYKDTSIESLTLSGGVSANKEIRLAFNNLAEEFNLTLNIVPKQYCTDNASMIAFLGFLKLYDNIFDIILNIEVEPTLRLK